jgi:hypothetical protein
MFLAVRRSSARTRAVAAVVVVALVTGIVVAATGLGLGGGDPESFRDRYREITLTYQARIEQTKATREQAKQPDDQFARRTYRDILAATRDALADYEELDPPGERQQAWQQFLASLRGQVGPLQQAVEQAEGGRPDGVGAALRAYGTSLAEWIVLRQEFDEAAGIEAPEPTDSPTTPPAA